jgi:hypothetical protein
MQVDFQCVAAALYIDWLKDDGELGADQLQPETLYEDLSDAIVLLRVVERVERTKVNIPATSVFKKIHNCSMLAAMSRLKDIPSEGII